MLYAPPKTPLPGDEVVRRLHALDEDYRRDFDTYVREFTHLRRPDIRLAALVKPQAVVVSAHLGMIALYDMCKHIWWTPRDPKLVMPTLTPTEREAALGCFETFLEHAFIQTYFMLTEHAFRVLLRAVDPTACIGGTAEFLSVYTCLLGKLARKPPDAVELLDLLRLVRNSIHNHGHYLHKSMANKQVEYKGLTYTFEIGKPADTEIGWSLLLQLADDVRVLFNEILRDPIILALPYTPEFTPPPSPTGAP